LPEILKLFDGAVEETQFSTATENVKHAIPIDW